jgi:hypothetical protein
MAIFHKSQCVEAICRSHQICPATFCKWKNSRANPNGRWPSSAKNPDEMKHILMSLLLFLPTESLFAQLEGLAVSMVLEHDTIFAFDPLRVQINVKNISTDPIYVLPISAENGRVNRMGVVDLEVLVSGDTTWQSTRQILNQRDELGCSYVTPIKNNTIELHSNQTLSASYVLTPIITLHSGTSVKFRVKYYFPAADKYFYSPAKVVYLKHYPNDDSLAYQYLKTLPRPSFVFHPLHSVVYDKTDMIFADHIASKWPNSKFAVYSRLFLAQCYFGLAFANVETHQNSAETIAFLRKAKFYGHSLLETYDPLFIHKSEEVLSSLGGLLFQMYTSDPPPDLVQEFLYAPRK